VLRIVGVLGVFSHGEGNPHAVEFRLLCLPIHNTTWSVHHEESQTPNDRESQQDRSEDDVPMLFLVLHAALAGDLTRAPHFDGTDCFSFPHSHTSIQTRHRVPPNSALTDQGSIRFGRKNQQELSAISSPHARDLKWLPPLVAEHGLSVT
jgi:hypothetical protein